MSDRGSQRDARLYSGGVTWARSANMVIDATYAYYGFIDQSNPVSKFEGYDKLWPGNNWYKAIHDSGVIPVVSPGMRITHGDGGSIMSSYSQGIGTNGPYWWKQPTQDFSTVKMAYSRGAHYLKTGFESRGSRSPQTPQITWPFFSFNAVSTAATYLNPDTRITGDGFASFQLGAVDGASMPVRVPANLTFRMYGLYLNDDWKIGRKLTLNLGLRYEYEQPYREMDDRAARGVDLTVPIPEFQGANAPQMPAAVRQYYPGSWTFNGAYRWTENGGGQWNAGPGTFSPRVGLAYRVDDKTSIRAAWGRYVGPWTRSTNITQGNFYGFSLETAAPGPILGVPQMTLDNPYPPSTFPVQPVIGKTLGGNTGLGNALSWIAVERPRQYINRINVSVQRQLAMGMVVDATYYINRFNTPSTRNVNMMDPRIAFTNRTAINQAVANPFYNILTPEKFPGTLRNQRTVPLSALMVPYPQYGALNVGEFDNNGGTLFQQLAIRVRKSYSNGLTFLGGYSYTYARNLVYYDDQDNFLLNRTWVPDTQPRHRVTFGGTWELPFGRGRWLGKNSNRFVDALIGGWNFSPVITYRTGFYLQFPGLVANGDPRIANPGPERWFDTSVFSVLPAFTRRTNPLIYEELTGSAYFNMDASIKKSFRVFERFSAELRADMFNMPNAMTWNDPSTSLGTFFGRSSGPLNANGIGIGRQTQLGLRIQF
jgi:hypothetical protein